MERRNALAAAISSAVYGKAYPEAEEMLAKSFDSAYSWMKKGDFAAQNRFQKLYPDLVERAGTIDAWLALTFLSIFSQGIAIGAGKDKVEPEDVGLAVTKACDMWPDCAEMRANSLLDALQHLIRWYDETFRHKEHLA